MVYLNYISCLRYTILVRNPRNDHEFVLIVMVGLYLPFEQSQHALEIMCITSLYFLAPYFEIALMQTSVLWLCSHCGVCMVPCFVSGHTLAWYYKRRCVACQHSPDNQTLWLQAGAGEDDVIHLPSGLDRVNCERQEDLSAYNVYLFTYIFMCSYYYSLHLLSADLHFYFFCCYYLT